MSTTLQRILVPVDGSNYSDKAVSLAMRLAREHGAEIMFCNAIDYAGIASETAMAGAVDLAGTFASLDDGAKELLLSASARALAASCRCKAYRLEGRAAAAIVTFAIEAEVDAIVMGTRGLGGLPHLLLGSTAEGVLRTATVPVFVVHANSRLAPAEATTAFTTIAVAIDDSEPSDAASAYAVELAAGTGSKLLFTSVIDAEALHDQMLRYGPNAAAIRSEWESEASALVDIAARQAAAAGVKSTQTVVAFGNPSEEILASADRANADLLAIGTHGRRGLRRLLIGSVAENVVRRGSIPIVVVRSLAELRKGLPADALNSVRAQLVNP